MNLSETAFLVKQPDHFDLRGSRPRSKWTVRQRRWHRLTSSAAKVRTTDEIRFSNQERHLEGQASMATTSSLISLEAGSSRGKPPPGLLQALGVSASTCKNQLDYLAEVESGPC